MRSLIILSVLFLVGCPSPNLPEEFVGCFHLYDESRTVLTESFDHIEQISSNNCPDVVRNRNGECPTLFRIVNLEGETVWLTGQEFENYECKRMENR